MGTQGTAQTTFEAHRQSTQTDMLRASWIDADVSGARNRPGTVAGSRLSSTRLLAGETVAGRAPSAVPVRQGRRRKFAAQGPVVPVPYVRQSVPWDAKSSRLATGKSLIGEKELCGDGAAGGSGLCSLMREGGGNGRRVAVRMRVWQLPVGTVDKWVWFWCGRSGCHWHRGRSLICLDAEDEDEGWCEVPLQPPGLCLSSPVSQLPQKANFQSLLPAAHWPLTGCSFWLRLQRWELGSSCMFGS